MSKLKVIDDELLLMNFKVARREMVAAMNAGKNPPTDDAIRKLAEMHQAIAAVEAVIADKEAGRV